MIVVRSTASFVAASAMVTSWRTSCNQISYFCEGDKNRFARLLPDPTPGSFSDIITSSFIDWRTRQSDQNPEGATRTQTQRRGDDRGGLAVALDDDAACRIMPRNYLVAAVCPGQVGRPQIPYRPIRRPLPAVHYRRLATRDQPC